MHTSSTGPLARLVAAEATALAALAVLAHPLGAADAAHRTWWLQAPVSNLAGTLGWWIAFALAGWCAATTVTCMAGRALPALHALRVLDACTAPGVRRAVDRALALSLTFGTISAVAVAAPAAAATTTTTTTATARRPPAVVRITPDGKIVIDPGSQPSTTKAPRRAAAATTTSTPSAKPAPTPAHRRAASQPRRLKPAAPTPTPAAPGRRVPVRPDLYTVAPGDNLWHIAAARLAAANRRVPTDGEIAPYWQRVVAANRPTLRSGDPNLIFPGELVTLPPLA